MAHQATDRAWRSLVALSVGDGFGERFFGPGDAVVPKILDRTLPDPEWRFTDDTMMAISVYEVVARHGTVDQDDLARRFAMRYIDDPRRGYGAGAHELLAAIARDSPWGPASRAMFNGTGSFGNGGAMRVPPLGAYFADSLETAAREAARSAEVTHAHAEGIAGTVATAVATAYVTSTAQFARDGFFDAVLEHTADSDTRRGIERARTLARDEPVETIAEQLGNGSRISAMDTVPFCMWVVSHYPRDFEQALWTTVEALGDRDTTCAIVAGILGSTLSPPRSWLDATEKLPIAGP